MGCIPSKEWMNEYLANSYNKLFEKYGVCLNDIEKVLDIIVNNTNYEKVEKTSTNED